MCTVPMKRKTHIPFIKRFIDRAFRESCFVSLGSTIDLFSLSFFDDHFWWMCVRFVFSFVVTCLSLWIARKNSTCVCHTHVTHMPTDFNRSRKIEQ